MTDNTLIVTNGNGARLAPYQSRDDVRELASRLLQMHPAANEVGEPAMRAAAQLALMLGANPLPGVNEMHIWRDDKGRNCMSLGINFWRRKAEEWGGVLYEIQPRMMRTEEATEYGIPNGVTAAICKAVRAVDMIRYRGLGFTAVEVWRMCGRVGVGTTAPNEYAKKGRPPSWTALKRAETDLLRQLFPAEFAGVDRQMMTGDAPIVISTGADVIAEDDPPPTRYTTADANRDFFGIEPARETTVNPAEDAPEDGDWTPAPAVKQAAPPAPARPAANDKSPTAPPVQPAADPGPLAGDELTINEAPAAEFFAQVATLLRTDEVTVKIRFAALGYTAVPGHSYKRVDAYRALKRDMGENEQAALFADAPAAATAGMEYKQD